MNKDKALESVNEIKELMEKSSKFISLSGLAAIMAGIYALVGAYIATQVITPGTHLIFQPPHLPGIVEFLSSDADRRCFMYFHPYARVL